MREGEKRENERKTKVTQWLNGNICYATLSMNGPDGLFIFFSNFGIFSEENWEKIEKLNYLKIRFSQN